MRNANPNYNTNSSLFSLDYKIPYEDKQTTRQIADHLEQSQNQLHFLKIKLTEAYEKLQHQITTNSHLQDRVAQMKNQIEQLSAEVCLQRNQNSKLKQVLQKILQNRKITEKELQNVNVQFSKKMKAKKQQIELLRQQQQKQIEQMRQKRRMEIQNIRVQIQKQVSKQIQQKSMKYMQQIQILQNQIEKITNQKVAQVRRLRHEIQCYQRRPNQLIDSENDIYNIEQTKNLIGAKLNPDCKNKSGDRTKRRRQFANQSHQTSISGNSHSNTSNMNFSDACLKQNVNCSNKPQYSQEQSIGKWKKKSEFNSRVTSKSVVQNNSVNQKNQRNTTPTKDLTKEVSSNGNADDQLLSQYQIKRKYLQNELVRLERIKRPLPSDRVQMEAIEKQLYAIDSDIAGLKRKIRSRY